MTGFRRFRSSARIVERHNKDFGDCQLRHTYDAESRRTAVTLVPGSRVDSHLGIGRHTHWDMEEIGLLTVSRLLLADRTEIDVVRGNRIKVVEQVEEFAIVLLA